MQKSRTAQFAIAAGLVVGLSVLGLATYHLQLGQQLHRVLGVWLWIGLVGMFLGMLVGGVVWYVRRRTSRPSLEPLALEDEAILNGSARDGYRRLQAKMSQAVLTLEQAPELQTAGVTPVYALPWYLLMGASQAGKTTLLQEVAKQFPSFVRSTTGTEGVTQDCDWWFFKTAVILDIAGEMVLPVDADHSKWSRFLRLLRHQRDLQPIEGIVVSVAADALLAKSEDVLRVEAAELRKRIDDAIRELGVHVPIYTLITRCDLIDGFTVFFRELPEAALNRVFGHVFETQPDLTGDVVPDAPASGFDVIFESLRSEVERLQLALFNGTSLPHAHLRRQLIGFPEEFRALQRPLRLYLDTLFSPNPFQHTPMLRGVFFNSALQQGVPHSELKRHLPFDRTDQALVPDRKLYFLHDLFAIILPRDRALATRRALDESHAPKVSCRYRTTT